MLFNKKHSNYTNMISPLNDTEISVNNAFYPHIQTRLIFLRLCKHCVNVLSTTFVQKSNFKIFFIIFFSKMLSTFCANIIFLHCANTCNIKSSKDQILHLLQSKYHLVVYPTIRLKIDDLLINWMLKHRIIFTDTNNNKIFKHITIFLKV